MLGAILGIVNKVFAVFSPKERKRRIKDAIKKYKRKRREVWKKVIKKHEQDKEHLLVGFYNRKIDKLEESLWNYE